ncbi:sarcosine oxidase delta subunit [Oxalobacteraceae bacterium GrIS 2.11]
MKASKKIIDKHNITCRDCGAVELKWRHTSGGRRLFSKERDSRGAKLPHVCRGVDFEKLT